MHELAKAVAEIRQNDSRYRAEAYFFVFEALHYAHNVLRIGAKLDDAPSEEPTQASGESESGDPSSEVERHLTGQELCEAIRIYALEQYGFMAKCVLNSWGVQATSDFGEIVFDLIEVRQMRKTPQDKREDFNDVFQFDTGLEQSFKITMPEG